MPLGTTNEAETGQTRGSDVERGGRWGVVEVGDVCQGVGPDGLTATNKVGLLQGQMQGRFLPYVLCSYLSYGVGVWR